MQDTENGLLLCYILFHCQLYFWVKNYSTGSNFTIEQPWESKRIIIKAKKIMKAIPKIAIKILAPLYFAIYYKPKYFSIPFAAFLPAPIARITVAAPVTISPPAKTPGIEVICVSGSTSMYPHLFVLSPGVV